MSIGRKILAAAALAGAVGFASAAQAVPYSNGLTIVSGTTTFKFGTCSVVFVGTATPHTCSSIQLIATKRQVGMVTAYGFAINSLISAVGVGSEIKITLNYAASDKNLATAFNDLILSQTGNNTSLASINDTVTDLGDVLHTTGNTPIATDVLDETRGFLTFQEVIDVKGTCVKKKNSNTCTPAAVQISVAQLLTTAKTAHRTPEPASLALVGAGLLGGGWKLGKRLRRRGA